MWVRAKVLYFLGLPWEVHPTQPPLFWALVALEQVMFQYKGLKNSQPGTVLSQT